MSFDTWTSSEPWKTYHSHCIYRKYKKRGYTKKCKYKNLKTIALYNNLLDEGMITETEKKMVLIVAQEFFKMTLNYVLIKMGIREIFWPHTAWINFLKT